MDYYVNHEEYLRILSFCTGIYRTHKYAYVLDLLMEVLDINARQYDEMYVISERLMRRIAIANLCDMGIMQYEDSNGECDYAGLGIHSTSVLKSILRNI